MKKLQLIVVALFLCYTTNLFSQKTEIKNRKSNVVFYQPESNNKRALNEQSEKIFLKQVYNTTNLDEFRKTKEYLNEDGITIRSYYQYYKGLKVMDGSCIVRSKDNDVLTVNGKYIKLDLDIQPKITQQQLTDFVLDVIYIEQKIEKSNKTKIEIAIDKKELVICENYKNPNKNDYHLAYKVYVSSNQPFIRSDYFIDAITGKLVGLANLACSVNTNGSAQTVYSGTKPIVSDSYNGQYRLREINRNGTTAIQTLNLNHYLEDEVATQATDFLDVNNDWLLSNHPVDKDAHDVHWATEKVIDYWKTVHNRNSLDNYGMTVKSYIHYGDAAYFENAFWGGTSYPYIPAMFYSDGYNKYKSLTSLDVVAHETAHAICQYTTNLYPFSGEPGAINEGLSDIWGAVIENWAMPNSPPKNKWLIGEEIIKTGSNLRNMSNPNASWTPSPDTYGGTYWGTGPYAYDPHLHCTVLDYWFYLLSDGGSGTNDPPLNNVFSVTGIGITKAAKIVYATEIFPLSQGANFAEMRAVSIKVARDSFGCGSAEEIAVTRAWYAVGVGANYSPITLSIISSSSSICATSGTATCTVNGVPDGLPITWTVTSNNVVSYSTSGNVCYIYRNTTANGLVTVTASITCGTTYSTTKNINVGNPISLYNYNGCGFSEAAKETGFDEGPCNTQCYSPGGPNKTWCAPTASNYSSITWQKTYSFPSNYGFWSASGNNVSLFFKGANQFIELKRTINNTCGSLVEYYCFSSSNTACNGNNILATPTDNCKNYDVNINSLSKQVQIKKNDNNCEETSLQLKSIQIVDKIGNVVKEQNYQAIKSNVYELNLSETKDDIYFVLIRYENDVLESHQIAIFK